MQSVGNFFVVSYLFSNATDEADCVSGFFVRNDKCMLHCFRGCVKLDFVFHFDAVGNRFESEIIHRRYMFVIEVKKTSFLFGSSFAETNLLCSV